MLALALNEARQFGLSRVMLTIDGDNPAPVRVIEKSADGLTAS